jgi:hypothetical protein
VQGWDISEDNIEICCLPNGEPWLLGEGSYGRVYKGLRGGVQDVAVKVSLTQSRSGRTKCVCLQLDCDLHCLSLSIWCVQVPAPFNGTLQQSMPLMFVLHAQSQTRVSIGVPRRAATNGLGVVKVNITWVGWSGRHTGTACDRRQSGCGVPEGDQHAEIDIVRSQHRAVLRRCPHGSTHARS